MSKKELLEMIGSASTIASVDQLEFDSGTVSGIAAVLELIGTAAETDGSKNGATVNKALRYLSGTLMETAATLDDMSRGLYTGPMKETVSA